MKSQEIMNALEQAPKCLEGRKTQKCISEIIGKAMALIACMCVSAIAIALTVKFIMWIL